MYHLKYRIKTTIDRSNFLAQNCMKLSAQNSK